ncbi:MAG: hypothetical protein KAR39_11630 [Thermoplasmata archaeon]|nr:hypothetical protein [Thermoplasmata archaeon]
MKHENYGTLVGYLVGSIMPQCAPLAIAIYAQAGGHHTTRVHVKEGRESARCVAKQLEKQFSPAVLRVWKNDSKPGWFYLQFDEAHPPRCLYGWSLPVSVYEVWRREDESGQGLVRLSISEQTLYSALADISDVRAALDRAERLDRA